MAQFVSALGLEDSVQNRQGSFSRLEKNNDTYNPNAPHKQAEYASPIKKTLCRKRMGNESQWKSSYVNETEMRVSPVCHNQTRS